MDNQYLLDENVAPLYRTQLLHKDARLKVWRVGDPNAPPTGTLDPEILCWCESNDFILVTNNRRSMPIHLADHLAAGRHVPGILIFEATQPIGIIIDELVLIARASFPGEYEDRITYIPVP